MAFVLDPSSTLSHEISRVAIERLDKAIATLEQLREADPDDVEDGVHDVRKRCKEVRAVARLARPTLGDQYGRFNRDVRDAARTLAPIRDAHALLGTLDDLRSTATGADTERIDAVREGQARAAEEATRAIEDGDRRIAHALDLLSGARAQVDRWTVPDGIGPLAKGLRARYKRGRKALRSARKRPTDERVHEWRKAVKTLWYHARLLERAAPSALDPLIATLDDLSDALGDDHDLAVLCARLKADPDRFGGSAAAKEARQLARRAQEDLRRRAFRLGATVYAETPRAFARRVVAYWERTVEDGPELPTGGIAELAEELAAERASGQEGGAPAGSSSPDAVAATAERERKFLVEALPALPAAGNALRQGYVAIDGRVSVRVRDAGPEGCTLTLKAGRGAVRTELEFPLTEEQFAAAWEHTRGRRIRKTRYAVELGERVVDLDVFHDDLHGLALAEIEFDSDDELAAFEPPDWFGREVTDDDAYTNASLAVHAPEGIPSAGRPR